MGPRSLALLGSLLVPAAAAVFVLRYLLPSRLGGAGGGLAGLLSWAADRYPLFVGLAIFLAISEAGRYWARRLGVASPVEGAAPRASASLVAASLPRRRLVLGLAALVVLVFALRTSVVATFRIVGPSMLPTLEVGDRVLVNRLAYEVSLPFRKAPISLHAPRRGDLVVFRANGLAGADGPQSLVKRVIGLPGDRVSYEQGSLDINGWRVPTCDAGPYVFLSGHLTVRGRLTVEFLGDRRYLTVRKPIESPFPGYTVQPGEVFVVGDDRGMSSDSRLWNDGRGAGVPVDILEGRVSRVLLGARPDGRLDFSRLLAPPLGLEVRMPGLDLRKTEERIGDCLRNAPSVTSPPPP